MAFPPQAAGAKKPGASGKWLSKKFGAPAAPKPQAPAGAPFPAHAAPFQQPPPHGMPPTTPPHPGAPPPPGAPPQMHAPPPMHAGAPPGQPPPSPMQDMGPHAANAAPPPGGAAPIASTGPQYGGKGPYMLAKDHVAATNVPPGGSSCSNCIYLSKDQSSCGNAFFIRWNGGNPELPAPADSYCSDWWEHATGVMNDGQDGDAGAAPGADAAGGVMGPDGKPLGDSAGPHAQNAAQKISSDDGKPLPGAPGEAPLDPEHAKRAFGPRDASGGQLPNAPTGPVQGKGQLPPTPDDQNPAEDLGATGKFAKKLGKKPKPVKPPPMA